MATAVVNRGTRAGKQEQQQQQQQGSPAAAMAGSPSSSQAAETAFDLEETYPLNSASKTARSSLCISSYSDPLVLEPHTAFQALLLAPLVMWWVAILLGMWVYEGRPHGQRVHHVMLWFDRGLLRPAGPLLPFAVLAARAGVHWLAHKLQVGGVSSSSSSGNRGVAARVQQQQRQQQQGMRLGSLALSCLVVYSSMAVARLAIYLTHYFLLKNRLLEFHVVSDHIFLAATMLISLHTELLCLMSDMLRAIRSRDSSNKAVLWHEVALALLFVVALSLYLFTAADMYYTAKYFHFPLESFSTTVLVFIMFQLPVVLWLVRQRSQR
ncbi:hypothetical protein COO60DRAFT_1702850 [Scenedesmus sp. NREL 46B-D3]|nr:hypothetical protein COO60DRAFT_1702850 [Scenedesmus sp. NREL 46B-D3]